MSEKSPAIDKPEEGNISPESEEEITQDFGFMREEVVKDRKGDRGVVKPTVPEEIMDNFDDAIDQKHKEEPNVDLNEDEQNRLANIEDQIRSGKPVNNMMQDAAEKEDLQSFSDLNKFGEIIKNYPGGNDASPRQKNINKKARQFGAALQTMAQTHEILLRNEQWLQENDKIGNEYISDIEAKLKTLIEHEDTPEHIKGLARQATEKLSETQKPTEQADQLETNQPAPQNPPAQPIPEPEPSTTKPEENEPETTPPEPETQAESSAKNPEDPFVSKEEKQENLRSITDRFNQYLEEGKDFEAAKYLAKMKRLGITFKGEGTEKEKDIKDQLILGYGKLADKAEEDGGVNAARYLSYLKYTGVTNETESFWREEKFKQAKESLQEAIKSEKEDIDWSLYAMHAKYLKLTDGLSDDEKEKMNNLLQKQTETINNNKNSTVDRQAINEARLKYIDKEREPQVTSEQINERLETHRSKDNYDAYTKLASVATYLNDEYRPQPDPNTRKKIHQNLQEKKQKQDWDAYMETAANASRLDQKTSKSTTEQTHEQETAPEDLGMGVIDVYVGQETDTSPETTTQDQTANTKSDEQASKTREDTEKTNTEDTKKDSAKAAGTEQEVSETDKENSQQEESYVKETQENNEDPLEILQKELQEDTDIETKTNRIIKRYFSSEISQLNEERLNNLKSGTQEAIRKTEGSIKKVEKQNIDSETKELFRKECYKTLGSYIRSWKEYYKNVDKFFPDRRSKQNHNKTKEQNSPRGPEMESYEKTIREQEYQKVKTRMGEFRKEHGIQKTPEELAEEDRELRNKFGLETGNTDNN